MAPVHVRLRAMPTCLGSSWQAASESGISPEEQVAVIDATIDDMSPQIYGIFRKKLLPKAHWTFIPPFI